MTIKENLTNYLSNKTLNDSDNDLLTNAAILFECKSTSKNGNMFLFERFGHADANTYNISSQITDHYMEDNVSRQDHWAIAPDTYTLSGFIGEVIYQPPKQWRGFVEKNVTNYLQPLAAISPTFDSYTQSALNVVQQLESSFRRYEQIARNIFSDLTGIGSRSNQAYVVALLKQAQLNRQLFNIWTPFKTFKNLAIQSISISQGNTKYKSRLEIQFKQWRTLSTETRQATDEEKQNYLALVQKATEQDSGTASTKEAPVSTLKKLGNKVFGK